MAERLNLGACPMHQETPITVIEVQRPFDRDGNFIIKKAINLALEQRALGAIEAADALDLLTDFFMTSQNYIFNDILPSRYEHSLDVFNPSVPGLTA